MSPKAQRIAIAEACGVQTLYWKAKYNNHGIEDCYITDSKEDAEEWPFKELGVESFVYLGKIPNYLNDLNAMHEAEKLLVGLTKFHGITFDTQAYDTYVVTLRKVSKHAAVSATAAQRAEAFLKTLNLWVDDKDA